MEVWIGELPWSIPSFKPYEMVWSDVNPHDGKKVQKYGDAAESRSCVHNHKFLPFIRLMVYHFN